MPQNRLSPHAPSARRHRMAHPWLTSEGCARLEAEAAKRGHHVDVFAALLLETIAAEDLFAAVIDADTIITATSEG